MYQSNHAWTATAKPIHAVVRQSRSAVDTATPSISLEPRLVRVCKARKARLEAGGFFRERPKYFFVETDGYNEYGAFSQNGPLLG